MPTLRTEAKNLVVVIVDCTDSMKQWAIEIRKRLSTFAVAVNTYLGDDTDMVYMGVGDPGRCSDDSILIPGIGRGPILETYLDQLRGFDQAGGGNQRESTEMALLACESIQRDSLRNAFIFVITDEMAYDQIDPRVASSLGLQGSGSTSDLIRRLEQWARVLTIFADTKCYGNAHASIFRPWWERMLPGSVIDLQDARRVVDVLLGAIAMSVHKYDVYSSMLQSFQAGTAHGTANIQSVHRSLAGLKARDPVPPVKSSIDLLDDP